ncbi:tubulin-specific chaperone A [Lethenteron reissneri]|uniref:tubulin-specific chaperone A n=1 Tax=Lethenteron reissneri TaxID=7753 RepID=UPI002AB6E152|nr:tubulin-specific chaperone A [Lethenteron reissneri]
MADPRQRQLKIKAGVVKRIAKETTMYKLELTQQEEKVEKMKTGGDEYMLKKQIEVLQEAKMMIPDCERRLAAAHGDLSQLVENEQDLADTEEYQAAVAILKEVKLESK